MGGEEGGGWREAGGRMNNKGVMRLQKREMGVCGVGVKGGRDGGGEGERERLKGFVSIG